MTGRSEELRRSLAGKRSWTGSFPTGKGELFWSYVYRHAGEAYGPASAWIIQEGLLEPVRYAVADSGWTGSMQLTLNRLLDSMSYRGKLEGFYYGLYHIPEKADPRDYHVYYFGPEGRIKRKVYFSNCLFESVFSQPEGMCIGYERTEEGVAPLREEVRPGNGAILDCVTREVEEQAGERPMTEMTLAELDQLWERAKET